MKTKISIPRIVLHAILLFGALFMIMPFAWMLLTSLKTRPEAMKVPIQWLPSVPQWGNYSLVMNKYNFSRYYINTATVAIITVIYQMISCSMAAYVFARLEFPGKNLIFVICLSVLMVPAQMIMIPRFLIIMKVGLLNTLAGIIIPNLPSIYGTFFLRQSFMSLPRELDESAMLDGCGFFSIYFKILLPLIKNGLIAFGLLTTLWCWNEMLWPLIVVHSEKNYVLSIAIASMQGEHGNNLPIVMTAGVYSMFPMLIMFLVGQKYFLEGIAVSGIKV